MSDDVSDPVIASYDILLTESFINRFLLQYPDRQSNLPYNNLTSQKPTELRLKPATGLVEVDVPINTRVNYDERKGLRLGNAMRRSRIISEGGSLGMAGGFNTGVGAAGRGKGVGVGGGDIIMGEDEGDGYESNDDRKAGVIMTTQTLGGRIVPPAEGDPVYMLGAFRESELLPSSLLTASTGQLTCNSSPDQLHLSPLAGIVQLRPQLHHLDALDEISLQKKAASKSKGEDAEPEARAIDMRVKSADKETGGQSNNELLKKIQEEKWERFNWIDENVWAPPFCETEIHCHVSTLIYLKLQDEESWDKYEEYMFNQSLGLPVQLESRISPDDYMDAMSAPRIDPIHPELAGQEMKMRRKQRG
ncbi:hypothetical protein KEM54_005431 [Ascosphaera aggregata]|nr:hypothetical protein KEM54_005431 [Ascosphaera aggregata]